MEEDKKIEEVHNTKKESCCEDGNCSICQKKKELGVEEQVQKNEFEKFEGIKPEKVVSERVVPQKIQMERDKVAYLFNEVNEKKDDKKSFEEDIIPKKEKIMKEEKKYDNYQKKKSLNLFFGILKFVLFLLLLIVVVYFSVLYSDKINEKLNLKIDSSNKSVEKSITDSNEKIVEKNGKTWVSYDEKKVNLEVFYSKSCGEECLGDDVLAFLQSKIPTLEVKKVDVDDTENKDLNYVTYFIFDDSVIQTSFYSQAKDLFVEKNGKFAFDSVGAGFSIGKQLTDLSEEGFLVGDENAKIKIVAVVDFSSEKCAVAQPILDKLATEFKGKVKFVYKVVTNTEDEKLAKISLASFCANDQKGFEDFSSLIFSRQKSWVDYKGDFDAVLTNYAVSSKLKKEDFVECLSGDKFKNDIEKMNAEIKDFGITGVPVYFVNGERVDGVITYDSLKAMINKAL